MDMERVLLSYTDVLEAVVCGVSQIRDISVQENQANGDTCRSLVIRAYIVKDRGSPLTAQDVDGFLAQKPPAMKGLEGGVVFLDCVPKTTMSRELCLETGSMSCLDPTRKFLEP